MSFTYADSCGICGLAIGPMTSAYLLSAQLSPHRVAILRWHPTLAGRAGVRAACSPEHVLEIVAHWMVSGRLDLSFTGVSTVASKHRQPPNGAVQAEMNSAGTCRPIGELVINQESVRKLVASDPEALASILDSLLEALQSDGGHRPKKRPVSGVKAPRQAIIA